MTAARGADAPHGTNARYINGCSCDLCRRAHADYMSRYRNLKRHDNASRVERCPTCGSPAYRRGDTFDYAMTQPGHPNGPRSSS